LLADGDCDLILSTHDFLSPIALQRLRSEFSAKIVLWFPDHAARLERAFMLCGLYDLLFFKDPYLVDRFRSELGLNQAHYLPECCRADLHTLGPAPGVAETRDLGTAGNIHPARAAVLKRLIKEGHRVTVWGPPVAKWMQEFSHQIETLPFVANHEKVRAFRSCKIILNTTHPAEVEGTNVRTFEAAAAGAFQLVNHRSALGSLFELDKEIVTFRSLDDLLDKVRHYLPRESERRAIADQAQARALAEHTYQHRLTSILSMLEQTNGDS
jgi:spore maturation protein CgeB